MTVHLVKLCVGVDEVDELRAWQAERLAERKARGEPAELYHITRMVPTRRDELLGGGSLYWVIKGFVRARQRLIDIQPFTDHEGIKRCRLVLDSDLVLTARQPRRPFQGWRYLKSEDAPKDVTADVDHDMPEEMRLELGRLGLL